MARDADLAGLLPEPPPPRPAAKDATIALAMRRFDGVADPLPPAAAARRKLRGGPIAAFASVLLVAGIGIPIALRAPSGPLGSPNLEAEAPIDPPVAAEAAPPARSAATVFESVPQRAARAEPKHAAAPVAPRSAQALPQPQAEPAPPPPSIASAPAPPAPERALVVTGQRRAPPAMDAPMAVTSLGEKTLGGDEVVVTGSRISGRARARGDWDACTVLDPAQSLRACKRLVDTGKKGTAGVAAAHVADGLTRGWQQDWDGAVAAFDQAVALQPRLGIAYLNRGLAYQRLGALDRAAADLDAAVRYSGHSARSFYHRSLIRRERGDRRGAEADAARAEALDARYADAPE